MVSVFFGSPKKDGQLRYAREPSTWFTTSRIVRLLPRLPVVGVISERPFYSLLLLYRALRVRLDLRSAAKGPCLVLRPLDARLRTGFRRSGLGSTMLMPRDLSAYDTDTLRNKGGHSNVTYWRYRPVQGEYLRCRAIFMIIDLDANATYAPTEEIQGVIGRAWQRLGNPSSLHRGGQRARAEVEKAREAVRRLVGATKDDLVVFTSGATEANNTVLGAGWRSVAVSAVEHPCVLGPAKRVQALGGEARIISCNADGEIESTEFRQTLAPETEVVSVMSANNETGVLNDIRALSDIARAVNPRIFFHTDAAQALGKMPISFSNIGVDALTVSGHKIGGLPGVGALIIKQGVHISPLLLGGAQEHKLRGGTENVLGIVSFGEAARVVHETLTTRIASMREARDAFEIALSQAVKGCEFNAHGVERLPNTSSVYISGVVGDDLVVALDLEGILVSSGAACSSGKPEPSHVLLAMGQGEERVRSTIRVSFRADQPVTIVPRIVDTIAGVVSRMRAESASN